VQLNRIAGKKTSFSVYNRSVINLKVNGRKLATTVNNTTSSWRGDSSGSGTLGNGGR
jgi:hypothetical protein